MSELLHNYLSSSDAAEVLENYQSLVKNLIAQFANRSNFDKQLRSIFNNDTNIDRFRSDWKRGDFVLPEIEIVSSQQINGANGAFSSQTGKIYLAQEFLSANQSDIDTIAAVIVEEYGHYVDSQINFSDTPGDEGAIFAALVLGEELSGDRLRELREEDDRAVVVVGGEEIAIEQASTNLINGLGGSAGFGESSLARNDDESTGLVDITPIFENGFNFFGTTYQGIYINNNGNITFNSPLSEFTPFAITGNTGQPIIAPFFADVDTTAGNLAPSSGGNSTGSNLVYWDFDFETDSVIITWDDVGRYKVEADDDEFDEANNSPTGGEVPNAFQLILRDLGDNNAEIEFRYEEIKWTVGTASDNTFARLGYSAADGINFLELPQSGNNQQLLSLETASNTQQPGKYVFSVINGTPNKLPVANPDTEIVNVGESVLIDVLANDSDPDPNDTLSIVSLDGSPFYGDATIVSVNGRQQIEYTPDTTKLTAGTIFANRRDNFGYIVTDGTDRVAVKSPGITVEINQLFAEDDSIVSSGLQPGGSLTIDVLSNDLDPEGDNFAIDSVGNPVFGTAQVVDNQIVYTPNNNFTGADSFEYTIRDARGATDTATINVSPEPIVNFDSLVIDGTEGTTQTVTLRRSGNLNVETTVDISLVTLSEALAQGSSNVSRLLNLVGAADTILTGLKKGITEVIGSIVGFPAAQIPSTASKVFSLVSKVIVPADILLSGYVQAQATADDINLSQTSITFAPGEDVKTVSVEYKADNLPEGDQTFYIELSSLENPQALGVIRDIDREPGEVGIDLNDDSDVTDLTVNTIAGAIVGAIGGAVAGIVVTQLVEILEDSWQQTIVDRLVSGFNSINSVNANSLNSNSYGLNIGTQEGETLNANQGGAEIRGYGGNDVINGDSGNDNLYGGEGEDILNGGEGFDSIVGGMGADTLSGGEGSDIFAGNLAELDGDVISDFTNEDVISVDNVSFTADSLTITLGSAILDIDTNLDGIIDSTITLEGDFTDTEFAVESATLGDVTTTFITIDNSELTDVNESNESSSNQSNSTVTPLSLSKSTNEDIWNIEGDAGTAVAKFSLVNKNSDHVNEVGVFKVDAENKVNGIAAGEVGFAKAALEQGQVIFSALADDLLNGVDLNRQLQVSAGEKLGFYFVSDGTVDGALNKNSFDNVSFSINEANGDSKDYLQVTEENGNYTLNWEQGNDNSFNDLVMNFGLENTPLTTQNLISDYQGRQEGELINLESFTGREVKATFTLHREAAYDNFVGFYKVKDAQGTITDEFGNTFTPGDDGYAELVVKQRIPGVELSVDNNQSVTIEDILDGGSLFAPFIISDANPDNLNGDLSKVYTPYITGNSDKVDHIRLLGDNIFGFEDFAGGGDNDFNDMIVEARFEIV